MARPVARHFHNYFLDPDKCSVNSVVTIASTLFLICFMLLQSQLSRKLMCSCVYELLKKGSYNGTD